MEFKARVLDEIIKDMSHECGSLVWPLTLKWVRNEIHIYIHTHAHISVILVTYLMIF